jgi:peptidoglycan-associated lipoprotein
MSEADQPASISQELASPAVLEAFRPVCNETGAARAGNRSNELMGTSLTRLLAAAGASALFAALLGGCGSTRTKEPPMPAPMIDPSRSALPPLVETPGADPGAVGRSGNPRVERMDPLENPTGPLAKRSVYFDLDRFDVKPEYNGMLDAHGKYLASHSDKRVVIQGNADERGSREYNIAIGARRAEAVEMRLRLLGVDPGQVETVSFGKERPRAKGENEQAWAQNRRADIVYR